MADKVEDPSEGGSQKKSDEGQAKKCSAVKEAKEKGREEMTNNRTEDDLAIDFFGLSIEETPAIIFAKPTGLICDEICLKHFCPFESDSGKNESPDRFRTSLRKVEAEGLLQRCVLVPLRPVTDEEVKANHSEEYLSILKSIPHLTDEELKSLAERYDSIFICKDSFDVATKVAGGVIDLVHRVQEGQLKNGFALVRPPGHHALYNEANGYSLLNNIAIAASKAINNWNVKRVLIVDWDVHHGQGVQRAFYNDPRVLYFSIHRYEQRSFWPHLPESNSDHIGEGDGRGYNVNVPWNKTGMGDVEYFTAFQQILIPMALEFQPELILVSAGYDSGQGDPKGEMSISPSFYGHLTQMLMGLANGKLALILEGGYNLETLSDGIVASIKALLGDPCPPFTSLSAPCQSAQETIMNTVLCLQPYWKCFQTSLNSTQNSYLNAVVDELDLCVDDEVAQENKTTSSVTKTYPIAPHRTCLVYDEKMKRHKLGAHPERPERISSIYSKHEEYGLIEKCLRIQSRHALEDELALCHSDKHIQAIAETSKLSPTDLAERQLRYNSIYLNPDSYDCALLAAGSLLNVIDTVLTGKAQSGVAIIRPPGHHAGEHGPAGFCFFNNVPIAARYAQKKYHTKRILIVDWDVHHGNGTQALLEDDPAILYISLHRFDGGTFYPGISGNPQNVGRGAGTGYNVNIAWNDGPMGDAEYLAAFRHVVMPIAYEYNPEVVLISAGFDAARGDPLGCYDLTPNGYGLMTQMLTTLAGGKLIVILEGGYNLQSMSESMARCTHSLLGGPCLKFDPGPPKSEAINSLIPTLMYHSNYWKSPAFNLKLLKHKIDEMAKVKKQRDADELASKASEQRSENTTEREEDSTSITASKSMISTSQSGLLQSCNESKEAIETEDENSTQFDSLAISSQQGNGSGDSIIYEGIKDEAVVTSCAQGAEGDGAVSSTGQEELMGAVGGSDEPAGIQISTLLPVGVDADEASMFAVVPLPWCPHLESSVNLLPAEGLDINAPCQICSDNSECWICLCCYQVFCGRFVNKHMLQHGLEQKHPVVLSFADLSVWCYGCDSYVHNEVILPAKKAAHLSKFGEDMPA